MTSKFLNMLKRRDWILADGATATNLFAMGLEAGDAPELWNETYPEKIDKLYRQVIGAGSDLFLTNSFGSNAARLKLHNAGHRAYALAKQAAAIGRNVADSFRRDVIVAGSVGPTGEIFEPVGTFSHTEAVEMFHEQAEGLKDGGADVLWLETISSQEEYIAAAEAFTKVDLPWCGTMSFDTYGRTMMGITSQNMLDVIQALDHPPDAFGANCGTGASDLLRTVKGFAAKKQTAAIIAKGNAGIPRYVDGYIHYDGTPDLMADYAVMARDIGAKIIGGCCGTGTEHIKKMRAALESRAPRQAPSLQEIAEKLGAFSSAGVGSDTSSKAKKRIRRRRRAP